MTSVRPSTREGVPPQLASLRSLKSARVTDGKRASTAPQDSFRRLPLQSSSVLPPSSLISPRSNQQGQAPSGVSNDNGGSSGGARSVSTYLMQPWWSIETKSNHHQGPPWAGDRRKGTGLYGIGPKTKGITNVVAAPSSQFGVVSQHQQQMQGSVISSSRPASSSSSSSVVSSSSLSSSSGRESPVPTSSSGRGGEVKEKIIIPAMWAQQKDTDDEYAAFLMQQRLETEAKSKDPNVQKYWQVMKKLKEDFADELQGREKLMDLKDLMSMLRRKVVKVEKEKEELKNVVNRWSEDRLVLEFNIQRLQTENEQLRYDLEKRAPQADSGKTTEAGYRRREAQFRSTMALLENELKQNEVVKRQLEFKCKELELELDTEQKKNIEIKQTNEEVVVAKKGLMMENKKVRDDYMMLKDSVGVITDELALVNKAHSFCATHTQLYMEGQQKIYELNNRLQDADLRNIKLQDLMDKQVTNLSDTNKNSSNEIVRLFDDISNLKKQLAETKQAHSLCAGYEIKNKEMEGKLKKMEPELAKANQYVLSLKAELAHARQEHASAEERLEQLQLGT